MLQELTVRNLGCLDENMNSTSLSQETVLIGPNNSGKSTFIAGLNLLRNYAFHSQCIWTSPLYDFIDRPQAVHDHEGQRRAVVVSAVIDTVRYGITNSATQTKLTPPNLVSQDNTALMRKIWYLRPNRSLIPYRATIGASRDPFQPLRPDGSDVVNFLLEKFNERDPNWDVAEKWLKKIDPEISWVRTMLRSRDSQTFFETVMGKLNVNARFQGSGFHSVASVVAAVVFSPEGSTLVIEEPEICLHKRSQEHVVDLFNDAVNNHNKQIVFSTHSWDMLLPFISDVGRGAKRGRQHVKADPAKFTLLAFNKSEGHVSIEPVDLGNMKVSDVKNYLKRLWG